MRSFKEIIIHYQNSPKVKLEKELVKFRQFLGIKLGSFKSQMMAFIYIKDKILFIGLNNPNAKFEFRRDDIINEIKISLTFFKKYQPDSLIPDIEDVKFFYASKFVQRIELSQMQKIKNFRPTIQEKSFGKFKNSVSDPEIWTIFEEIRQIIIDRRSD